MNKIEQQAYQWLTQILNISDDDIAFQNGSSPDYILRDDRKFEVKKIYSYRNSPPFITIYSKQYQVLRKLSKLKIIAYSNEDIVPSNIIPWEEIDFEKGEWQNLKILIPTDSNKKQYVFHRPPALSPELLNRLGNYITKYDDILKRAGQKLPSKSGRMWSTIEQALDSFLTIMEKFQ